MPGVTHIPAEYTWRRIVGGSGLWVDTGTDAVAFVEQAKRAGAGSPPDRASHPTAVTARCCDYPCGTTEPN